MNKNRKKLFHHSKKVWTFFWKDESIWSWLANIVVAFLLIRFVVYPILGIILGTGFPIVAVVSESMDHGLSDNLLCGEHFDNGFKESFDNYWDTCGLWYESKGISKAEFKKFPFRNGFYKGDVIILYRTKNLEVGDILVFQGNKPQPIIHRIVKAWEEDGQDFYQTKGDHNSDSSEPIQEMKISKERLLGKGLVRIPYLGWLKILFVDAVRPLGIVIER